MYGACVMDRALPDVKQNKQTNGPNDKYIFICGPCVMIILQNSLKIVVPRNAGSYITFLSTFY